MIFGCAPGLSSAPGPSDAPDNVIDILQSELQKLRGENLKLKSSKYHVKRKQSVINMRIYIVQISLALDT